MKYFKNIIPFILVVATSMTFVGCDLQSNSQSTEKKNEQKILKTTPLPKEGSLTNEEFVQLGEKAQEEGRKVHPKIQPMGINATIPKPVSLMPEVMPTEIEKAQGTDNVISFDERQQNVCVGKSCFKTTLWVQGTAFYLQGLGKRTHLLFDVYAAGFYLSDQALTKTKGVPDGAKLIILEYNRKVEKQKVVDSIIEGVDSNPDADAPNLRARFDRFSDAFTPPVKDSRYYFVYVPGEGTSLIENGEVKITIQGEDFARAFYGLWFHDVVGNPELKEKLLAGY